MGGQRVIFQKSKRTEKGRKPFKEKILTYTIDTTVYKKDKNLQYSLGNVKFNTL